MLVNAIQINEDAFIKYLSNRGSRRIIQPRPTKEEFNYASYSSRLGAMLIDVLVFQFLMLLVKYWGCVGKWYYIINSTVRSV